MTGARAAAPAAFYPRIIREFDDGPDEEPMLYGGGRPGRPH